jgi:TatD DNase family protein
MIIDTHSHVYLAEFSKDRKEMIQRARDVGVHNILLPNIDTTSISDLDALCTSENGFFYGMMGMHPGSVKASYKKELAIIKTRLFEGKYCGVGEIGIDLYWDKTFLKEQIEVFRAQIEWALELELPIAIHARDSFAEIFKVMNPFKNSDLKGVFHCFSGSDKEMQEALSFNNFMLGIGGVVTFKNSGLDKTIVNAPLERIVLETDSPYLAPVPNRGKRNEPSYIRLVAEKLAIIKGVEIEEIEKTTTDNAIELFKLSLND